MATAVVPRRLRAIDLFCGAGGLSLGLKRAGFEIRFALDHDGHACATYERNLGDHVVCGDIAEWSPQDILSQAQIGVGELDLVAGGPPCQGFSVQRRGDRMDPRNDLAIIFMERALGLRPAAILLENVPGLLGERGIDHRRAILALLEKHGYDHTSRVLQAEDFDVPQDRRRGFIVAWNPRRIEGFEFPARPGSVVRTVRDAIGDLPEPPRDFTCHPLYPNHVRVRVSPLNEERIHNVPYGGGRLDLPFHLQLPCHRNAGSHRHLDVYGRMTWEGPAPTITARFDNFTRGRFAHPESDRTITGREGARIQSFPDDFVFLGPKKDVARQIGNAVPPLLAQAVGDSLVASLNTSDGDGTSPLENEQALRGARHERY